MTYLSKIGMNVIEAYENKLTRYAIARLEKIPGLRIFGPAGARSGAVSFEVEGVHPHDMAQFADREGVAIRAGHLCAQPLMRRLNVPAVNRASVYLYNLEAEIDQLAAAILKAKEFFAHGTR